MSLHTKCAIFGYARFCTVSAMHGFARPSNRRCPVFAAKRIKKLNFFCEVALTVSLGRLRNPSLCANTNRLTACLEVQVRLSANPSLLKTFTLWTVVMSGVSPLIQMTQLIHRINQSPDHSIPTRNFSFDTDLDPATKPGTTEKSPSPPPPKKKNF